MDKTITVGVTGLNAIDSPGPGVAVSRALRDSKDFKVNIIGLAYESLEPGLYMHNLINKTYQIPYPSAGSKSLKDRLEQIHAKEKLDVIIPNFDAELSNFIRLAPELDTWGVKTFLPTLDQLEMLDKIHLSDFCEKHGFLVPNTKFISSVHQIDDVMEEFDFPVLVKGKFYEAYIAQNTGQIITYFNKLNAKWGLPVLIQEFVSGTEINIAGLGRGTQELMGAVPIRKLYITERGKGWSGVVLGDEVLVELAEKFMKASRWKGGFELELMRTEEEEFYVMEVNPRFPAWIYAASAAGQNMPAALVNMAIGEQVNPFEGFEVGKMFIRYSWDLITDINEFQQISMTGEL